MTKEISTIRKYLLFPYSWIGWIIAIIFLLVFIFPEYMLYFLIISIVVTILILSLGKVYLKNIERKLYLTRFIAVIFFIFAIYLIYNYGKISPVYTGIGLLIFIIGIVIGYQSLKRYASEEMHKSLYYVSYNVISPLLFVLAPIFFILLLIVGITQNKPSAIIFGIIFSLIFLIIGFLGRKRMKKELSR